MHITSHDNIRIGLFEIEDANVQFYHMPTLGSKKMTSRPSN